MFSPLTEKKLIMTNDVPCLQIVKGHTYGLFKQLKYSTFGDPERSRSLTNISDAEYLANGSR